MIFGPAFKMIPEIADPADCFGIFSAYEKFDFDKFDADKFDSEKFDIEKLDQELHGLDDLIQTALDGDCPLLDIIQTTTLDDEWLNAFADPNDVYAPSNDASFGEEHEQQLCADSVSVKVENVKEEEEKNYVNVDYTADNNALRYNSHLDNITIKNEICDSDSYYSENSFPSTPENPTESDNSPDSPDPLSNKALKHDHNYTNLTPQSFPKKRRQDTATPSSKKQCSASTTTTGNTTTITITLQQPRKVGRPRKVKPPENGSDIENSYFEPKGQPNSTNYYRQARKVTQKGSPKVHHTASSSKRGTTAKRDHKEMERQRRLQLKRKFESCYSAVPTHYFIDKKTGKQNTNPSKARILNSARQYMLTVVPYFHEIDSQVISYERQVYASNKHVRTLMKRCQDLFA